MKNTFMNQLKNDTNYGYTENGALTHRTTNNAVYDMFAMGAAYRNRTDADVILLFKNAFEENEELAMKCLFWIRDCRGGAGERRFFKVCMKWLAENHPEAARRNIEYFSEYGRWDDLYTMVDTPLEKDAFELIKEQLEKDVVDVINGTEKTGISLLAKWLKSENASAAETKRLAKKTREYLDIPASTYRKTLSKLRERIKVLERLMSTNRWEEIDFSKIPSKAGLIYKNAFARRDLIAEKYEKFAKDKNTVVNAETLYPYEVVSRVIYAVVSKDIFFKECFRKKELNDIDRAILNKYWENLPDYLNGSNCSMLCVVDTSASMHGAAASAPINVAISLGLYCAEHISGPFANHYISFSSRPQLIKTEGIDFVDKVQRIYKTNLCENTNLEAVFDLLLNTALDNNVKKEDIPKTIVVISDMEIDEGSGVNYYFYYRGTKNAEDNPWTRESAATEMEKIRIKWASHGLQLPKLVYWNVDARNNNILDAGPNVSFVSGMSPVIFKSVLTGKTGWDLCLDAICSERYAVIK